jgi:hypothetical protein
MRSNDCNGAMYHENWGYRLGRAGSWNYRRSESLARTNILVKYIYDQYNDKKGIVIQTVVP